VSRYWVFDWIDEQGIRTHEDARRAIHTISGLKAFLRHAHMEREVEFPRNEALHQLLAGPSMDLSGNLECGNPVCMTANVERLLRKSILYFDRVVVTGLEPFRLSPYIERKTSRPLEKEALRHIDVALHVREMGAEDVLVFSRKVSLCTEHLNQHAIDAGMSPVDEQVAQLTEHFAQGGRFTRFQWKNGRLHLRYMHPDLGDDIGWGGVRKTLPGESPTRATEAKEVAGQIARTRVGELVRSAASAKISESALGMTSDLPIDFHIPKQPAVSVEQVALSLPLPINDAIPIRDLIALRQEEPAAFQAFQLALRKAIKEHLRSQESDNALGEAEEIMGDIVEPALIAIDRRVTSASELAYRNTMASAGVGLTLLTVGLIAAAPVAVPGLVIAASGLALSMREYYKAQAEIKLEDMYFLWRASQASISHAAPHS
jgi:hypothetical protein